MNGRAPDFGPVPPANGALLFNAAVEKSAAIDSVKATKPKSTKPVETLGRRSMYRVAISPAPNKSSPHTMLAAIAATGTPVATPAEPGLSRAASQSVTTVTKMLKMSRPSTVQGFISDDTVGTSLWLPLPCRNHDSVSHRVASIVYDRNIEHLRVEIKTGTSPLGTSGGLVVISYVK